METLRSIKDDFQSFTKDKEKLVKGQMDHTIIGSISSSNTNSSSDSCSNTLESLIGEKSRKLTPIKKRKRRYREDLKG